MMGAGRSWVMSEGRLAGQGHTLDWWRPPVPPQSWPWGFGCGACTGYGAKVGQGKRQGGIGIYMYRYAEQAKDRKDVG